VLMKRPGGTQRQSPDDDTTTLVGYVLSMSSSALTTHQYVGLPDLPYFTGDPTFQPRSPASVDELMDKNLPYFVGGNLATLLVWCLVGEFCMTILTLVI